VFSCPEYVTLNPQTCLLSCRGKSQLLFHIAQNKNKLKGINLQLKQ